MSRKRIAKTKLLERWTKGFGTCYWWSFINLWYVVYFKQGIKF